MNVEAVEDATNIAGARAKGRGETAVSRLLISAFVVEIVLAAFVAGAFCKILLTPRPAKASERGVKTRLVWIDELGHRVKAVDLIGRYASPRSFPGSSSILLNKLEPSEMAVCSFQALLGGGDVFSAEHIQVAPACPIRGRTGFAVLSPDGREIVFESWSRGVLRSRTEEAAFRPRELGTTDIACIPEDWSSDGRWIAFTRRRGTSYELWLFEVPSSRATLLLKADQISEPRFSPDARWIAFAANFGSNDEIYLLRVPFEPLSAGFKKDLMRISEHGGRSPRWGDSIHDLFYLSDDQELMRVKWREQPFVRNEISELFNVRSAAGPSYEYRFDGYTVDRSRRAFVFALAGAVKLED